MKKNILIIGINGFIGFHCAEFFNKMKEYQVFGCDITEKNFIDNYIKIDPENPDFDSIFREFEIDICLNCSGAANVPMSLEKPFLDFELNTFNVFKILNAIRVFRPSCKFLNLSSAAVYGNPKSLPIKEEDSLQPVSPYGFHKRMAEMICEEFYRFWNIPTLSLRIFSAYGPGLKKQILWDLSQKLKSLPETIELFGTGNETRDFIYISDLVKLIFMVIEKADFNGTTLNAANGHQIFISQIAEECKNALSPETKIKFSGNNRKGDPLNWEAEVSKIKNLGYLPEYELKNGIETYVNWLKSNQLI